MLSSQHAHTLQTTAPYLLQLKYVLKLQVILDYHEEKGPLESADQKI